MNILEYIDELINNGMSEEDAYRCADCMYLEEFDYED